MDMLICAETESQYKHLKLIYIVLLPYLRMKSDIGDGIKALGICRTPGLSMTL